MLRCSKCCSRWVCDVFDTSTYTWSSPIPDTYERRLYCQTVAVSTKTYVMGGCNGSTTTSSVKVFETSISSLYPVKDNYAPQT